MKRQYSITDNSRLAGRGSILHALPALISCGKSSRRCSLPADRRLRPKPSIAQKFLGVANLGDALTGSIIGLCGMRNRPLSHDQDLAAPEEIVQRCVILALPQGPASRPCFRILMSFNHFQQTLLVYHSRLPLQIRL